MFYRRILTGFTVLVAALALPASAQAGGGGSTPVWTTAPTVPCATGAIDTYSAHFQRNLWNTGDDLVIEFFGSIKPCTPLTAVGPKFGYVGYWNDGGEGRTTHQYLTGDVSTSFRIVATQSNWGVAGRMQAICLNNTDVKRVACLAVNITVPPVDPSVLDPGAPTVTLAPLATDDPRVAKPYVGPNHTDHPDCIVCP